MIRKKLLGQATYSVIHMYEPYLINIVYYISLQLLHLHKSKVKELKSTLFIVNRVDQIKKALFPTHLIIGINWLELKLKEQTEIRVVSSYHRKNIDVNNFA